MKSLFPKPLKSTRDMLLICIIDFLLQLKSFESHKIYSYCGLLSFDILPNVYKVVKSGNEWHARVDRRGFGTKQDFIRCFSLCMFKIYDRVRKQFLQLQDFLFDIFYSKFQLYSINISIWSKFCVENWLFLLWPELQMSNM